MAICNEKKSLNLDKDKVVQDNIINQRYIEDLERAIQQETGLKYKQMQEMGKLEELQACREQDVRAQKIEYEQMSREYENQKSTIECLNERINLTDNTVKQLSQKQQNLGL